MKILVFLLYEFNQKIYLVVKYMYCFFINIFNFEEICFNYEKKIIYFILDLKKNVYVYFLRRVCLNYDFLLSFQILMQSLKYN